MLRSIAMALLATLCIFSPAGTKAQSDPRFETVEPTSGPFGMFGTRQYLGYGRLTTNDLFGDGKDRWRTGSLFSSRAWAYDWNGRPPYQFGDLIELRLNSQIIAPDDLVRVNTDDRRWAGALSAGLHTHFMRGQTEFAVGADIVLIGPQTNLDDFQDWFHQLINVRSPSDEVLDLQISNKIRPTAVVEAGRTFRWAGNGTVRPFAEARAGEESLVRVGADLTFGVAGLEELLVRESITGQRVRVIKNNQVGLSLLMGADIAHVFDSAYLPDNGPDLKDTRERARIGFQWQGESTGFFYGLTYLSEEFEGQPEGQVVGSLKLDIRW